MRVNKDVSLLLYGDNSLERLGKDFEMKMIARTEENLPEINA
jgi:hypothetical protein